MTVSFHVALLLFLKQKKRNACRQKRQLNISPVPYKSYKGLTCIQNLDDDWGLFNVQGDVIKPAVLHQEHEDVQTVVQGALGLCLKSAGLIWVILGPEPVSKVVVQNIVERE